MWNTLGTATYPIYAGTVMMPGMGSLSGMYINPDYHKEYSLLHLLLVKCRSFKKRIGGF